MFLMSSADKHKSEKQTAADKRFLDAIEKKSSVRIVDGTFYVGVEDVEDKLAALKKRAQVLLKR
ncbi:hypothetical protein [Xanthomonas hortorum]|uniref:hypothetical protein n=2 Tax=Xanthomonas TaxID=338 RepID=UPI0005C5BC89|nr:hypothetical protein [Xanthomonas hortorum]APP85821.1 hypothetical protein BI317_18280 [Xanthomonas hortorum pv. gardneri]ASW48115.1 hypothetical protein XJ27_20865 [Xanthomonas hortorum]MCC8496574.1 hypothetical protein [Xanthomonas hortorum pv. gardneri]MCE4280743.1 hypothetical protein [Xanthomonas hortorum pv. vitians]MCE4305263.1 hypothetical protein [Xanthomonas hortorum pv. vitians]